MATSASRSHGPGNTGAGSRGTDSDGAPPKALRAAYWFLVVGAVLALVAAAMLATAEVPDAIREWDPQHAENVLSNLRVLAAVHAGGGLAVAIVAPHVRRGSSGARTAASFALALTTVADLMGLATQLIGPAVVAGIVCFVAAAVAMFRPAANRFIAARKKDRTH